MPHNPGASLSGTGAQGPCLVRRTPQKCAILLCSAHASPPPAQTLKETPGEVLIFCLVSNKAMEFHTILGPASQERAAGELS